MKDLMFDLETLSLLPNAAIFQIGACYFDRHSGEIFESFLCNVDIQTTFNLGFKAHADTIYWWLNRSEKARKGLVKDRIPIESAIESFISFTLGTETIWCHKDFDYPILRNYFDVLKPSVQIDYRRIYDIRTLTGLAKFDHRKLLREGIHHDALDDCIHQAKYCATCINLLGL